MHECPHGILLIAGRGDNLLYQFVVGESAGAAQCILDQVLGEAAGKVILPRGDQISQLEKVLERRPLEKGIGGVDRPGLRAELFGRPPLAGGIKVFEPEADRIDLSMSARTLRLFPMGRKPLAGGERLVGES